MLQSHQDLQKELIQPINHQNMVAQNDSNIPDLEID